MKRNLVIMLLTGIVLLTVAFLAIDLHNDSERAILDQFNEHQLMLANEIAQRIEKDLDDDAIYLELFSSRPSFQYFDVNKIKEEMGLFLQLSAKGEAYEKDLTIFNEKGRAIYSADSVNRHPDQFLDELAIEARKPEHKGKAFASALFLVPGREGCQDQDLESPEGKVYPCYRLSLVAPIWQEAVDLGCYSSPSGKFVGFLALTIDIEELMQDQFRLLHTDKQLHQTIVVDGEGTILHDSSHPEIVLQDIVNNNDNCDQFHASLKSEPQGTMVCTPQNSTKMVAAFAKVKFANLDWTIILNKPYREVTALVAQSLWQTLVLLAVVLFTVIGSAALIYRGYRRQVRTEVEMKQLRARAALEDKIRDSEERYRTLVELSPDAIAVHSEGKVVFANTACTKLLRAETIDQLIGKPALDLVHPDYHSAVRERLRRMAAQGGGAPLAEEKFLRLDGSIVDTEVAAQTCTFNGRPAVQVFVRDITERKKTDEIIKASLNEKEILLKEIHHRVKNNLQVISSLLNIQSGYVQDKAAQELFKESQNRVKSMALIHEKLYQSSDFARVDFASYIRSLTSYLFQSYAVAAKGLTLLTDIDDVHLGIDTSIPCGLMVNELVSNALKHAFPNGHGGEVRVSLKEQEGQRITLSVGDNGVGFPEDLDFRNVPSLGLQLISTLVGQLQGTIELKRDKGTEFQINFCV